jgi:phosphoribosylformylglycinamidine synthase (EC 6.3.5.3)
LKMSDRVRRIFVEKKAGFDVQAQGLLSDIKESLGINSIKGIRLLNRYDISGISDEVYEGSKIHYICRASG